MQKVSFGFAPEEGVMTADHNSSVLLGGWSRATNVSFKLMSKETVGCVLLSP